MAGKEGEKGFSGMKRGGIRLILNNLLESTYEDSNGLSRETIRFIPTRTDFKHIFDTPSDAAGHIKASLIGN